MSDNNLNLVKESAGLYGFRYVTGTTLEGNFSFLVVEETGECSAVTTSAGDDLRVAVREAGAPIAGNFTSVTADATCVIRCYISRNK